MIQTSRVMFAAILRALMGNPTLCVPSGMLLCKSAPHTTPRIVVLRAMKAATGAILVQGITITARGRIALGVLVHLWVQTPRRLTCSPVCLINPPPSMASGRPAAAARAKSTRRRTLAVAHVMASGIATRVPLPAGYPSPRLITKKARHPLPVAMELTALPISPLILHLLGLVHGPSSPGPRLFRHPEGPMRLLQPRQSPLLLHTPPTRHQPSHQRHPQCPRRPLPKISARPRLPPARFPHQSPPHMPCYRHLLTRRYSRSLLPPATMTRHHPPINQFRHRRWPPPVSPSWLIWPPSQHSRPPRQSLTLWQKSPSRLSLQLLLQLVWPSLYLGRPSKLRGI